MSARSVPDVYKDGSLFRRGGLWAPRRDVAYYMMWFEYLALSPSYELARKFRAGILTDADRARLPADFHTVLAVYDDLGDVQAVSFEQWWLETAIPLFGYQGEKPHVARVSLLKPDTIEPAVKLKSSAQGYVEGAWHKQGQQTTLVLAIPVGLPKAQIAKQVAAFVEKLPEAERQTISRPPKYKLMKRKLDSKSLFKYIMCMWLKANAPKVALWRLGVHAKVSSTYSGRLDPMAKLPRHQQADDRNALKILTCRAIHRAHMMAENAARGIFPSYAKCAHAVHFDLQILDEQRKARRKRERAEEQKLANRRSTKA